VCEGPERKALIVALKDSPVGAIAMKRYAKETTHSIAVHQSQINEDPAALQRRGPWRLGRTVKA
jgi:hypothetical protein